MAACSYNQYDKFFNPCGKNRPPQRTSLNFSEKKSTTARGPANYFTEGSVPALLMPNIQPPWPGGNPRIHKEYVHFTQNGPKIKPRDPSSWKRSESIMQTGCYENNHHELQDETSKLILSLVIPSLRHGYLVTDGDTVTQICQKCWTNTYQRGDKATRARQGWSRDIKTMI